MLRAIDLGTTAPVPILWEVGAGLPLVLWVRLFLGGQEGCGRGCGGCGQWLTFFGEDRVCSTYGTT